MIPLRTSSHAIRNSLLERCIEPVCSTRLLTSTAFSTSTLPGCYAVIATMGVFALTALRAVLAPCMVILAIRQAPGWAFIACLTVAFLSDIYDGVLARRFGVATPGLRRFDSITDDIFYRISK